MTTLFPYEIALSTSFWENFAILTIFLWQKTPKVGRQCQFITCFEICWMPGLMYETSITFPSEQKTGCCCRWLSSSSPSRHFMSDTGAAKCRCHFGGKCTHFDHCSRATISSFAFQSSALGITDSKFLTVAEPLTNGSSQQNEPYDGSPNNGNYNQPLRRVESRNGFRQLGKLLNVSGNKWRRNRRFMKAPCNRSPGFSSSRVTPRQ